ncbi:MAG TPA: TonB family protein [Terriglobales bacterium]|nr:TonB family protein [Terriglobales bacterium]
MFEDSLFASSSVRNPRRGWTAFVSFLIQTFFISVLVALPLLFTQALPLMHWTDYLTVPPAAAPTVAETPTPHHSPTQTDVEKTVMLQPATIPHDIVQTPDEPPPMEAYGHPGPGVPGSTGPEGGGFMDSLFNSMHPSSARPVLERPKKPVQVSTGVSQGLLLRQVKPVYPPIAIAAHVQGKVVLQAVIGKDGTIQNLHVISGHPMLIRPAMDAVQQWRYRPYLLNGEPVEVETQIQVTFTIS